MKKTALPNLPQKRAADYEITEHKGKKLSSAVYARVIYTPQESHPDRAVIEVQAFQVDKKGGFMAIQSGPRAGTPSRTPGTRHNIALTGLGDTHTLQEGWVRVVGSYSKTPDATIVPPQQPLPEGTKEVKTLPTSAEVGDYAWMNETLYRWDEGMVETVLRGKADELIGIVANSESIANFEL